MRTAFTAAWGPPQIRTWRFPSSGSSVDRGSWEHVPDLDSDQGLGQRVGRQVTTESLPCEATALASTSQPVEPDSGRALKQLVDLLAVPTDREVTEVSAQPRTELGVLDLQRVMHV